MTPNTLPTLANALRQYHLLIPEQLETYSRELEPRFPEPRALAREMVRRGMLTPYQANQLFLGRGAQLLLGSYVLLERIGEGGMGTVFKARNWKFNTIVAIKVIKKDRLARPEAVKRFYREIRAVAQLNHPNIVRAFDADEVQGTHFFVMEYVEGIDLHQVVKKRGPLPIAMACDCIRQAALGLQHAFERGLVHRDIKPHNLLLASGGLKLPVSSPDSDTGGLRPPLGVVKILDMGLALTETLAEEDDHSSTMTQSGIVMGTPDYMAPEQSLDSHDVDIRADLYSLGCTLYFLLTARAPFPGGTLTSKLLRHQNDKPESVRGVRPDLPDAVEAVLDRLLAKRREDRYQTPMELGWALEQVRGGVLPDVPNTTVTKPIQVALSPTNEASRTEVVVREGWAEIAPGSAPGERPQAPVSRMAIVLACLGILALLGGIWWATRPTPGADPNSKTRPKPADKQEQPKSKLPALIPGPVTDEWIRAVREQPAEKQVEAVFAKLRELNPGFEEENPSNSHEIKNGAVVALGFDQPITDISPVRALAALQSLQAHGRAAGGFGIAPPVVSLADISPLRGLPLRRVQFWSQRVRDLSPLADAPLEVVEVANTLVNDLSPLRKCPLVSLNVSGTLVYDLGPLRDRTSLTSLVASNTAVRDASPLAGLTRLTHLDLSQTGVSDLTPLKNLPLGTLLLSDSAVEDLAPLEGMKLKRLAMEGAPLKSFAALRTMTDLQYLSGDFQPARDTALLAELKKLKELNDRAPASFHKNARPDPDGDAYLAKVAALPPDKQVEAVCERLRKLNSFLPNVAAEYADDAVVALTLTKKEPGSGDGVTLIDLSPLAALKQLRRLEIVDVPFGRLSLWPLRNLRLEKLHLQSTTGEPIDDLDALAGMPLKSLIVNGSIRSLAPLRLLPLEELQCKGGLNLTPLRGMPLKSFTQMWGITGNVEALAGVKLERIAIGYVEERHGAVLRAMKSLRTINDKKADEFWKEITEQQVEFVRREMKRLNPDFTGLMHFVINGGVVTELTFVSDQVKDLTPLKQLRTLKTINDKPASEVLK